MSLLKSLGRNEKLRGALCWLVAQYIRFVWWTGDWRKINQHIAQDYIDRQQAYILGFWHSRLIMMSKHWSGPGEFLMLISQHRDGQLISRTVSHLGISTVAGSSTRGGAGAIRTILKQLKAGTPVGITPDGPRGPRRRSSAGIVQIAKLSGAPIIPVSYSCVAHRRLRSWDRLVIPLPFSRGVLLWGEPIHIPKDMEAEQARQMIEDAINRISDQADAMLDIPPEDSPPPLTGEAAS